MHTDVPIIRCMGLNYKDHAREANMDIPKDPVLFIKPRTAINGPWPAKINVPKFVQDGSSDYEAELTFIISKDGRDIKKEDALDYVLGYTCGNDVSARIQQFKNSQVSESKPQYMLRKADQDHSGAFQKVTSLNGLVQVCDTNRSI
ncbi:uncharacterized protein N0V89_001690 [Didymosphaeria variabile]|uniref:Fumarylacetoacetase-like C-terminal domain-containing protein n=1 Tax=Didymosphaeria variabile TaxID=1932322 RepID=A0A9W8XXQ1_9PLEO|nr:uncharacterized protein N0V89_001690 [Didymosphaeria variabile]KAJ4361121.1 hypothetical protein N0V89_001690 [Didymosphaeria variabile]